MKWAILLHFLILSKKDLHVRRPSVQGDFRYSVIDAAQEVSLLVEGDFESQNDSLEDLQEGLEEDAVSQADSPENFEQYLSQNLIQEDQGNLFLPWQDDSFMEVSIELNESFIEAARRSG